MDHRSSLALAVALVTSASFSACAVTPNRTAYDPKQAESEIRELEQAWAQVAVSGDPSVMERILADDFLGVSPEGAQYTKRGFIEDTRAHPLGFQSNELNDVKVRFSGNIAIAQGDETFTTREGERSRFVWTDVLERRDGRWQIVAAQDVIAPVAASSGSAAVFSAPQAADGAQQRIAETRGAYVAAWNAADAIAQLYAEDAIVLYPNQAPVAGRAAIRAYFAGFFAEFSKHEFSLASSEVVMLGDWALDRGTYRWKGLPAAGGAAEEDHGKYLVALRRGADGAWQVARDMDNSDRPAAQSARGTH